MNDQHTGAVIGSVTKGKHMRRWIKSLSSLKIVLICVALGVLSSIAFGFFIRFDNQKPPSLLPLHTIKAGAVVGAEARGFFSATPIILTREGRLGRYVGSKHEEVRTISALPEEMSSASCEKKHIKKIEKVAGKISSCQGVQPWGEWCSAPYTVYATTPDGQLWEYEEQRVCWFVVVSLSLMSVPVGIVLGFLLIAARKIYLDLSE